MIISVASGKGGAGKTAVSTSLAAVFENSVYVDMDGEEPNGHIILKPDIEKTEDIMLTIPEIQPGVCDYCGKCADNCPSYAIAIIKRKKKHVFFRELCHSCGVCSYVCPKKGAIIERQVKKGEIRAGTAGRIKFMDAMLTVGDASAASILASINEKLRDRYRGHNVIIDSAPGTACTAVEGLKEADAVVLVAEPTLFSLNDMKLVVELVRGLKKHLAGIVVNKYEEGNRIIHDYAAKEKIKVLGEIPFSMKAARGYSKGVPLVESGFEKEIRDIAENIKNNTAGVK